MTRFAVSAYAASPAFAKWDPAVEDEFLTGLRALPGVVGLEVPWINGIHPHDTDWFLRHLPPQTELAITPLPWVMGAIGRDAAYGIASPDSDGRRAAIEDLARVAVDARRIASETNVSVAIVELHTAPRLTASADALERSLDEISTWDWAGAQLVIEHCDARVDGQRPEKGFLPIEDELLALERSGAPVGMWLNWGRSAIELRDADAVTAQIRAVAESGRLIGLGFSGAGAADGPYGAAWIDAHLPIHETHPEAHSVLNAAHVAAARTAAGDPEWTVLKISRRPGDDTAASALQTVAQNLEIVQRPI